MKFGESILYRSSISTIQRIAFMFSGQDFIGAAIRHCHFVRCLRMLHTPLTSVLDAGCGTGDYTFYIAEKNPQWNITACDISKQILKKNKEIQNIIGLKNIVFSYKDLLFFKEKDKYDFIYSIGVLIYFSKEETKNILLHLTKSLKYGGYLYLDLPQKDFLEITIIPPQYYPFLYTHHQNQKPGDLYTYEEMQSLLRDIGYELIFTNKSFGYFGKCAWECDNVLREHNLGKLRLMLLPILKCLCFFDAIWKNKKGCSFVLLARKVKKT